MTDLHLVRLALDRRALLRNTRRGSWDEGYLLHAGLAKVFAQCSDEKAVVPLLTFCVDDTLGRRASESDLFLLAYSEFDESTLHRQMGPAAKSIVSQCVSRAVPPITAGTIVDFRSRVCPVVRVKRDEDGKPAVDSKGRARSREVDAWLAERFADWTREPPTSEGPFERSAQEWSQREAAYTVWLGRELESGDRERRQYPEPAAVLEQDTTRMASFQRVRMHRKGGSEGGPERPDVVLTGRLRVRDEEGFRALLRRGVGRHRAFGFGMLRIRRGP